MIDSHSGGIKACENLFTYLSESVRNSTDPYCLYAFSGATGPFIFEPLRFFSKFTRSQVISNLMEILSQHS